MFHFYGIAFYFYGNFILVIAIVNISLQWTYV
ncbi:MAG: hypothetical protein H6R25_109 [Proteobacteria bacterium]|nr:hypothetical protein [Pseudomonadota bacterium]